MAYVVSKKAGFDESRLNVDKSIELSVLGHLIGVKVSDTQSGLRTRTRIPPMMGIRKVRMNRIEHRFRKSSVPVYLGNEHTQRH